MDLQIVNPDPKYSTVTLIPPTTLGYVHLAAEVRPPPRPGPVIRTPRQRAELMQRLHVNGALEIHDLLDGPPIVDPAATGATNARSDA